MVAWTRAVVLGTGKRGQVRDIFLEKESTDLDNRLDMRGEGDGKVRDDPQIWGLSCCVDSGTIV